MLNVLNNAIGRYARERHQISEMTGTSVKKFTGRLLSVELIVCNERVGLRLV